MPLARIPWLSDVTRLYRPSLPARPPDYILSSFSLVWRRQQDNAACTTSLIRLISMVLKMGGCWPYNCFFVGCCIQDLFNIPRRILVQLPSSFFLIRFVSIHVVHPYSRMDTTTALKKLRFILSDSSDFHMTANQSTTVNAFASCVFMSFFVGETLLPMLVNLSTSYREPPYSMELYIVLCFRVIFLSYNNCLFTLLYGFEKLIIILMILS